MEFRVEFEYEGFGGLLSLVKQKRTEQFVAMYNAFCHQSNALLPFINGTWDNLNPNIDLEDESNRARYNDFVKVRYVAIANAINTDNPNSPVELWIDDGPDICGRIRGNQENIIRVRIVTG